MMLMAVMTDDDIASDNVDEKDEEIGDAEVLPKVHKPPTQV